MAILNTNEIMFTAFEPKLQNRFIMLIDGIPSYLIKKTQRPNISFTNITLDHINKSASRNADGSFLYADQPYFLKEEDIEDIKDNSDKYGFLRDAEGNYMMVRKHTQYGQQQPVLDRNEQVIYVDISIFSEETSIEIDKEKQIQKLKQQAEEMGF